MSDEPNDAPKSLWGVTRARAAAAGDPGNVDAERAAHEEAEQARHALLQRKLQIELRQRQREGPGIAVEAQRVRRAYEKALQGVAGKDFWPDRRCKTCGGVEWLDAERNRIKMFHDPEKHGVEVDSEVAPRARQMSLTSLSALAGNMRARRSTGEHDDDDE
jgi:hypothetical protein